MDDHDCVSRQVHAIYFTAESAAKRSDGIEDLNRFLTLSEGEMEPSEHRKATTIESTKLNQQYSFRHRKSQMQKFFAEVQELGRDLGHVWDRGLMTLWLTGTFRAEAEFSVVKTRRATNLSSTKRFRRQHVGGSTKLRDFYRVTEALNDRRDVRNSVNADKTERRPPTDLFSDLTGELEKALTKHGHKLLRKELKMIEDYIVAVAKHADGVPIAWDVEHRHEPKPTHPEFRSLKPTTRRVTATTDADGSVRLMCSCGFAAAMGLPCRHICAVNGGASLEDAAVRWHMAAHQGFLDAVFSRLLAGDRRYSGALATAAATSWCAIELPGTPACPSPAASGCCTWSLVPGPWSLVPGPWSLVPHKQAR